MAVEIYTGEEREARRFDNLEVGSYGCVVIRLDDSLADLTDKKFDDAVYGLKNGKSRSKFVVIERDEAGIMIVFSEWLEHKEGYRVFGDEAKLLCAGSIDYNFDLEIDEKTGKGRYVFKAREITEGSGSLAEELNPHDSENFMAELLDYFSDGFFAYRY